MKILVLGGDGIIARVLIPKLSKHDVYTTTRRKIGSKQIFLDLSSVKEDFLGSYDCVIVCACDFKRGRTDKEQSLCWDTNVLGLQKAISNIKFKHIIFLSSYLSGGDTAYGKQKKVIEDWIKKITGHYSILRIGRINTVGEYRLVANKIKQCAKNRIYGMMEIL